MGFEASWHVTLAASGWMEFEMIVDNNMIR